MQYRNFKVGHTQCLLISIMIWYGSSQLLAVPMNNNHQPQLFHSVRGTNKFYMPVESTQWSASISPYYYHARTASDSLHHRVSLGNLNGDWNLFGLFYGQDGVPEGKTIDSYPKLGNAQTAIKALSTQPATTTNKYTKKDYTNALTFDPETDYVGSYWDQHPYPTTSSESLPRSGVLLRSEATGIRSDFSLVFPSGIGINLRGGIRSYRTEPRFVLTDEMGLEAGVPPKSPPTDASAQKIYENLLRENIFIGIAEELGIDLRGACTTHAEDIHINLFWQQGFSCRNDAGLVDCVVAPYLAIGLWLPAGTQTQSARPFALSTGNDGYTSFTFEGQINLHFPQMIQLGLGIGFAVPIDTDTRELYMPTDRGQSGIYPWKTMTKIAPGYTWSVNLSMKSQIYESLSCYFDYVFTEHDEDHFEICDTSTTRRKAFEIGASMLKELSCWHQQIARFGFEYTACPSVTLGAAVTGCISGVRVARPTETMGTLRISF